MCCKITAITYTSGIYFRINRTLAVCWLVKTRAPWEKLLTNSQLSDSCPTLAHGRHIILLCNAINLLLKPRQDIAVILHTL